jgi:tRNA pseudouridine38-40 synthase
MNLRLDIAYDGEPFRGFAKQPGHRTVQGDLEVAMSRMFGAEPTIHVAGRTDAGVHATGQVISIPDAPDGIDLARVRTSLNTMCGPAIAVRSVQEVPEGWHARFDARSRTYVYAILSAPVHDPFLVRTAWFRPSPLDIELMNEAAGHLLGDRDFTSFGRLPDPEMTGRRTLLHLEATRTGALVRLRVRASSFIQQMVRSLAGTLVEVGEGRRDPGSMGAILEARDRAAAGQVAPPHGLCLVAVEYDMGWSGAPVV